MTTPAREAWVSMCAANTQLGVRVRKVQRLVRVGLITVCRLPGGARPLIAKSEIDRLARECVVGDAWAVSEHRFLTYTG